MRCFISINIPKEITKEIECIQGELPDFYGKKTRLEDLHLTLKFLGEISEDKVKEVKNKLKEINLKDFEIEIKYLGFFDNKKDGILWLHLSSCEELQKQIDNKLKYLFEPEKRFMSHLTIARVKSIKGKRNFLEDLEKIKIPKIRFKAETFYLMKSELTHEGPRYKIIEEYKLN